MRLPASFLCLQVFLHVFTSGVPMQGVSLQAPTSLTGTWSDSDGETIEITQTGTTLECTTSAAWGSAQGTVERDGPGVFLRFQNHTVVTGRFTSDLNRIAWFNGTSEAPIWLRVDTEVTKVHIVYMTHLDVGYWSNTDSSMISVLRMYQDEWFPMAQNTSAVLRETGGPPFVWTEHPWLLEMLLHNATGTATAAQVENLEASMRKGDITWHAAPFNLQSEMSDPSLYAAGLNISKRLDAKYGQSAKTVASQKDVPGSTLGVLSLLSAAGVKALHVGVNDFCTPPAVPESSPELYAGCNSFVWRDTTAEADLVCFWCGGYSEMPWASAPEMIVKIPGLDEVLVFLMNVDNRGPHSPEQVRAGWSATQAAFPNATLHLSSLDAFAAAVEPFKSSLPVVTQELGDTWIYGVASDPAKVRRYRVAAREAAAALREGGVGGGDAEVVKFHRHLVKIPEHTWGDNEGQVANVPFDNIYFRSHNTDKDFVTVQASFIEQRAVVDTAVAALGNSTLGQKIANATRLTDPPLSVPPPATSLSLWTDATAAVQCGGVTVQFDTSAALVSLEVNGTQYAASANPLGRMLYRTHSAAEFDAFTSSYMHPPCGGASDGCGFAKSGLNAANGTSSTTVPTVRQAYKDTESCAFRFDLELPLSLIEEYGAPQFVVLDVTVRVGGDVTAAFDLTWFNKPPTRMAESLWMEFRPVTTAFMSLDKLGRLIDPTNVAVNGSRTLHAVWSGVHWFSSKATATARGPGPDLNPRVDGSFDAVWAEGQGPVLSLLSVDTALVAIGADPTPIPQLTAQGDPGHGLAFCLFNNAWNTNYPPWSLDAQDRFRFEFVVPK